MSLLPKTQYDFQPSPSRSRLFFSSPVKRTSPSLDSPATEVAAILDSLDGLVRGCSASDSLAEEVPEMQREKTERTRRQSTSMDGGRSFIIALCCIGLYMVILILSSTSKSSLAILHQVPEGHVGVYWTGGALLKTITDPGFHLKMPLVTHFEPIQVTLQTDQVKDIPCGTKGGVMINFEKIEVVNRLHKGYVYEALLNYGVKYDNLWIYDKIHHEINQFCSSHSLQQVYIDMFDQERTKLSETYFSGYIYIYIYEGIYGSHFYKRDSKVHTPVHHLHSAHF